MDKHRIYLAQREPKLALLEDRKQHLIHDRKLNRWALEDCLKLLQEINKNLEEKLEQLEWALERSGRKTQSSGKRYEL